MKQFVLLLIFGLYYQFSCAQLTQSQSQIMQLMSNDSNWTFRQSGHNKDGEPYLSYNSKEKSWVKTFYFKNDICGLIITLIPNEQLSDVIKDLNNRFTSMGNNMWTDDKEKTVYDLMLKDGGSFFEVDEVLLSAIQLNSPKTNSN